VNQAILTAVLASSVKEATDNTRYMLASHNVVPNYRANTADPATTPAQTYHVSAVTVERAPWTPSNYKWCFQNGYTNNTGATPAELTPPTPITIRAALFNANTFVANLTFGGQQETTVTAGGLVWCDALPNSTVPASGQLWIRTYSALPNGGQRPGRRQRGTGTKVNIFATSDQNAALALLSSSSITNNSGFPNNYAFGPVMQIADNWDGRPVVLIVGDSIAAGNDNADGESWISNALNSSSGGGQYGYANIAIHGTRPSNQTGDSQYGQKAALIDSVVTMNNGRLPMTSIISEMGVNDAGGTNVASLQAKMQAFLNYIHSKWSKAKLIQTTYTPRVTSDAATLQTDVSVMLTKQMSPANADRWGVADWIKTTPLPLVGHIDVRSVWTGSDTGTVWRDLGYSALLTSAASIGATSIVVDTAPPLGICPVISVGNLTSVESTAIPITAVTGTGPYTLTLGKALTKAHAIGDLVKASPSVDGLHPEEGYFSDLARDVVIAAKTNGLFSV
jgi:hypothetical protein